MFSSWQEPEHALLAVVQLLEATRIKSPDSLAVSTMVQLGRGFRIDPQHSIATDPQLWERLAAGEVGSPVPPWITCWDGPPRAKAWLQVDLRLACHHRTPVPSIPCLLACLLAAVHPQARVQGSGV
jgi:hypothetical protein